MYHPANLTPSRTCTWRRVFLIVSCSSLFLSPCSQAANTIIEEITVTAHRTATPPVPLVATISHNEIERRDLSVGPEILATLPGLAISRNGAFGSQAQVRVRGAEANHLQVLVDGIEMNDPAIGSEYNFANLSLAGITQIEFAPGAQSAVWGSDALAGVLNLVSTPTQARRELALTGGSFNTWQGQGSLANRSDSAYYSLAASHFDTDGTNTAQQGNEDDGFTSTSLHLSQGSLNRVVTHQLVLRYSDSKTDTDPAPFPISVPIDGDQRTDHSELAGKLQLTIEPDNASWSASLGLTYLQTENDNRVDGSVTDTVDGERLRLSLSNFWQLNERQLITMIVEQEREEFSQTGTPGFFGDPNQRQDGTTNSVSMEHIGRWGRWQTSVSARFDSNDDFKDSSSYRLASRYRLHDHWQLFAAIATGIKNPSFYERFGFTPANFVGNADLDPERNQHTSIGLLFANPRARVQFTLFKDNLHDEINGFAATATPGVFTATNLAADSDRQGLELQANGQLGGWVISTGYTYLDSEDPAGEPELRRPEHSGHIQLGRSFAGARGFAQLGTIFTGEQLDTDFRTFSPVRLDAYNRMHLNLSYQLHDKLLLSARVENALDDTTEDVFMFAAPERAAYLTIKATL